MLTRRSGQRPGVAGPPRLDLRLWRRAKMILLLNVVPMAVAGYIALGWWQGRLHFRPGAQHSLVILGVVLGACVLFAIAVWVVLPLARWLRDYPLWHVRHGAGIRWWIPMALGTIAWVVLGVLGMASAITGLALLGTGIVRFLRG